MQVGCTLMAGLALKMVSNPRDQINLLKVGHPGFRIGASEEQQGLNDAPEPQGIGMQSVEDALVLLSGPPAVPSDVDGGDQGRQWGSKLM